MQESLLRLPTVMARTGLSKSSVYLKTSKGEFPKPIPLGTRAVGWLESDIQAWINQRIEQGKNGASHNAQ